MWRIADAATCDMEPFVKLSEKIQRHRSNILNSIQYHMNSSRSKATNCTIKALIATAWGFSNLDNMFALIHLRCSDLVIPLHNKYQPSPEKQRVLREIQNQHRREREERRKQVFTGGLAGCFTNPDCRSAFVHSFIISGRNRPEIDACGCRVRAIEGPLLFKELPADIRYLIDHAHSPKDGKIPVADDVRPFQNVDQQHLCRPLPDPRKL